MVFFDYIFYRVYKFYFEFNESSPWVFGIAALSFSMYFIFDSLTILLLKPAFNAFDIFYVHKGHWVAAGILCFNVIRYSWIKPYAKLEQRWGNRKGDLGEAIKGWLVFIYLLGTVVLALYLTGFFKK